MLFPSRTSNSSLLMTVGHQRLTQFFKETVGIIGYLYTINGSFLELCSSFPETVISDLVV